MADTYTLYDYLSSGNGYKVRLVLKHLGLPYRLVQLDITRGATRTPQFLEMNPNGRIPLLEIPGQGFLAESHAIISYLAEGSRLVSSIRSSILRGCESCLRASSSILSVTSSITCIRAPPSTRRLLK